MLMNASVILVVLEFVITLKDLTFVPALLAICLTSLKCCVLVRDELL